MKLSDYLNTPNADQFNTEIKSAADDQYLESGTYGVKKDKFLITDNYREKQAEVADVAFQASSVREGLTIYLYYRFFHSRCLFYRCPYFKKASYI